MFQLQCTTVISVVHCENEKVPPFSDASNLLPPRNNSRKIEGSEYPDMRPCSVAWLGVDEVMMQMENHGEASLARLETDRAHAACFHLPVRNMARGAITGRCTINQGRDRSAATSARRERRGR